jgi:hypothetical protein
MLNPAFIDLMFARVVRKVLDDPQQWLNAV